MSSLRAAPPNQAPTGSPATGVAQRVRFTKMHGAGNDFVVLDETRARLHLSAAQYRLLGDRHFGVGADQILSVRPAPSPELDFEYVIHNADGGEVEQCGNGSRCFVRYVVDKGLTDKTAIRVQTMGGVIEPQLRPDGLVTVNMGAPIFDAPRIPFDPTGLAATAQGSYQNWTVAPGGITNTATLSIAIASMGNPHAMTVVSDVDAAPVATLGPAVQALPAFPQGVNVGFMQVLGRHAVRLRVYERGAGETLACGSGACAAVAMGIRLGLLDSPVTVHMRGGDLQIEWAGETSTGTFAPVLMSGPATTVYEGEIDLPAI